ncbi:unnamed protein product [marine sediment metagenome]|uniref:Uncharacterized protein n=1 Tax=marine sediment metagenome TaxID=412755 RepID=X0UW65_9ZZZZ
MTKYINDKVLNNTMKKEDKFCIMSVRHNKHSNQKLVTIPKGMDVKKGEQVLITKIKEKDILQLRQNILRNK